MNKQMITLSLCLLAMAGCRRVRPATQPANGQISVDAREDFPYLIAFERGSTWFAPGDQIAITEVRGTSSDMHNGICRISGTYTLASQDMAMIVASVTARDSADGRGPWNSAQAMPITKGNGTFVLMLPISVKGWPHVSFYGKSIDFGGTYIGTGDSVLRK